MADFIIAEDRLWLTADKKAVVKEGDVRAAFLYAIPGTRIPMEAAQRFDLLPKQKPKRRTTKKAAPKSKNKAAPKSKNK